MYTFDNLMKDANALDTMMQKLIDLPTEVNTLDDEKSREAFVKLYEAKIALLQFYAQTRNYGTAA